VKNQKRHKKKTSSATPNDGSPGLSVPLLTLVPTLLVALLMLDENSKLFASFLLAVFFGGWTWIRTRRRSTPQRILLATVVSLLPFLVLLTSISSSPKLETLELVRSAGPNETLVILSQYIPYGKSSFNVADRLRDRMHELSAEWDLSNVRFDVCDKRLSEAQADSLGKAAGALCVVWGWYDDLGFRSKIIFTRSARTSAAFDIEEIPSEDPDYSFYISEGVPNQLSFYSFFIIGKIKYEERKFGPSFAALNASLTCLSSPPLGGRLSPALADVGSILFARANCRYALNHEVDSVLLDLNRCMALLGRTPHVLNNVAAMLIASHRIEEAISTCNEALTKDPKYSKAYYHRGLAFQMKGQVDASIKDWMVAIRIDSNYVFAINNLGVALMEKQEYAQAISYFNRVLSKSPGHITSLENRARAQMFLGQRNGAINDLETIIRIVDSPQKIASLEMYIKCLRDEQCWDLLKDSLSGGPLSQHRSHIFWEGQ
jgi:tetratricopeptide (TPR) repeat protein